MLDDLVRTRAFVEAVQRVVREGDVVIDLGTGSGVLAVAAAQAGASHVYAIEASDISDVARKVFEVNGVADRVTLLEGWSPHLEVPEPGDVLVSEMLGNEPLDEDLLETTLDARRRLLKPDARLIPQGVKIVARSVAIPPEEVGKMRVTANSIDEWRESYGIDFGPLEEASRGLSRVALLEADRIQGWRPLGDPVVLADVDLTSFDELQIAASVSVTGCNEAVDGVALSFIADLDGVTSVTTDPFDLGRASAWRNQILLLGEPLTVPADDDFVLTYHHRVPGRRDGVSISLPAAATES